MTLALYDFNATEFDGSEDRVVAIKEVKVNDYHGNRQLWVPAESKIKFDPNIPEAFKLVFDELLCE